MILEFFEEEFGVTWNPIKKGLLNGFVKFLFKLTKFSLLIWSVA